MWVGGFGSSLVDRSPRSDSSDDVTCCTCSHRRERGQNCEVWQTGIFSGFIRILIGRFMGYKWHLAFRLLRAMQWERSASVVSFFDSTDRTNAKRHFACRHFRPSVRLMSSRLANLSTRRLRLGIWLCDISNFATSTCNSHFNFSNLTAPSSELLQLIRIQTTGS
jgi:hypothetical protein